MITIRIKQEGGTGYFYKPILTLIGCMLLLHFFSFSKIKNLMYFMGTLWIEAISSEFKWQQGFRLFLEEKLLQSKTNEPLGFPRLGF